MTRTSWTVFATVSWLPALAVAQGLPEGRLDPGVAPSLASQTLPVASAPAAALLYKRVDSVNWTDQTFEDVIKWLRDESDGQVNVVARWNHLGVEGVGLDDLVNLQLNNTTVADVLNETLGLLSESGEVRYRAEGNKLTISTRRDFERKLYTKVYDVTDVLFRVPNFGQSAPQIDLQNAARSGGGAGGGGGGQGVFGGAGGGGGQQDQEDTGQQAEQALEERLTKLRELIEQTIEPSSWDLTGSGSAQASSGGGGQGRIRIFNRSLVVTNTIEVHEQIAGLFAYGQ